jgi:hypothetical protein
LRLLLATIGLTKTLVLQWAVFCIAEHADERTGHLPAKAGSKVDSSNSKTWAKD